jgi:hypothetical protein
VGRHRVSISETAIVVIALLLNIKLLRLLRVYEVI